MFRASSLVLAAALTACVRVHSTPLASTAYPAVPADSVRLFALNPPAKYTEVAIMSTQRIFGSDRKAVAALREKAGRLGANGVLLLNPRAAVLGSSGPNVGVIVGGHSPSTVIVGDHGSEIDEFGRAVAIRYFADSSTADATRTAAKP